MLDLLAQILMERLNTVDVRSVVPKVVVTLLEIQKTI